MSTHSASGGGGCGGSTGGGDGEADGGGDGEADGGSAAATPPGVGAGGLGGDSHCSSPTSAHELPLYTQRPYPPLVARWANAAPQRAGSPS